MHSLSLSIKTNARPRGHCVPCETESPEEKHQLTFLSCCPGKRILTGLNNFLPPSLQFPFRITDRTYHRGWDGKRSRHDLQIQSRETGKKEGRQAVAVAHGWLQAWQVFVKPTFSFHGRVLKSGGISKWRLTPASLPDGGSPLFPQHKGAAVCTGH